MQTDLKKIFLILWLSLVDNINITAFIFQLKWLIVLNLLVASREHHKFMKLYTCLLKITCFPHSMYNCLIDQILNRNN